MGSLDHLSGTKRLLSKEIQIFEYKFVQLGIFKNGGLLVSVEAKSVCIEKIMAE